MAHNLYRNNMMWYGQRPWHGLGTELKNPATAAEAIAAAGMNFKVAYQQLYRKLRNGTYAPLPSNGETVNVNDDMHLGIVGDGYQIIQNTDAFDFFDAVVGQGIARYCTAGALGKGERIWILAQLPQDIMIKGVDVVEKFMLLMNSHDGSSALRMFLTPVRVVCQNTLNQALARGKGEGIAIRHSGDIDHKVTEAQRVLGIAIATYNRFEAEANAMASIDMTIKDVESYFDSICFKTEKDKESSTRQNKKEDLRVLFENGAGNNIKSIKHTLWAAYNAVTDFNCHRTIRNEEDDPTARLRSIWYGASANMNIEAYAKAMEVVATH
jgi:phage/plasmid-like protein (TIGR03299 family)